MGIGLKMEDIPSSWRPAVSLVAFVAVVLTVASFVLTSVRAEARSAAREVVMEEWAVEVKKAAIDAAKVAARDAVIEQVGMIAKEQAILQSDIREVDTRLSTHIQVKDTENDRRLNRLEKKNGW